MLVVAGLQSEFETVYIFDKARFRAGLVFIFMPVVEQGFAGSNGTDNFLNSGFLAPIFFKVNDP
ncbi:MAG: hypothetical protein VYA08_05830, partial [Pseudomonadota bacterium]|nr:hypothetical protein [Pseudomonadota bacterium]